MQMMAVASFRNQRSRDRADRHGIATAFQTIRGHLSGQSLIGYSFRLLRLKRQSDLRRGLTKVRD